MLPSMTQAAPASTPVRILFVLPADPERMVIGGIASFVRGFIKFAPEDFELGLVGMTSTRSLGMWHEIELEGRRVEFFPVARGRPDRRGLVPVALTFMSGLVRHRGALDLEGRILSFHRPGTAIPFRRSGVPMWRVVHLSIGDLTTKGSESRWRSIRGLLTRAEAASFRRMDRIYIVNEAVLDEYRLLFPLLADRLRFLPNWADSTIFAPLDEPDRQGVRSAVGAELQLPASSLRLIYAGRLEGQKNPQLLGEAFAELSARTGACLIVAGSGSQEEQLRRALANRGALDGVRFVGTQPRDRLARLMQASDIAVITSRYETGPTIGFEALATGLPIAMTNVGQVARLVQEHGAGRTVDEHTADGLADAMEWIAEQSTEDLRSAARNAAAPFLAERVLGDVYEYNRSLAARTAKDRR